MNSSPRLRTLGLLAVAFAFAMLGTAWAFNANHVDQMKKTGSCVSCDLSSADLTGINAESGDLTNANLTFANLYRAVLTGANLKGASLNGANLSGAVLRDAREVDLTGAITDERTICPNGEKGPCK